MNTRVKKTLERVLSKAGAGSRTDARQWICAGRVKVNAHVVRDPDHWVDMKRDRVRLTEPGRISHVKGFDTLPVGLQELIRASFALNDRIVRLDLAMEVRVERHVGQPEAIDGPPPVSPVQTQVMRLERAFSARPKLRAVPR